MILKNPTVLAERRIVRGGRAEIVATWSHGWQSCSIRHDSAGVRPLKVLDYRGETTQALSIKCLMWFVMLSAKPHLCLTSDAVALELTATEGRLCGSANSAHVGSGDAQLGKFPAFAGRLRASAQHPTS